MIVLYGFVCFVKESEVGGVKGVDVLCFVLWFGIGIGVVFLGKGVFVFGLFVIILLVVIVLLLDFCNC